MIASIVVLATVFFMAFRLWAMMESRNDKLAKGGLSNGSETALNHFWHYFVGQYDLNILSIAYTHLTMFNILIFFLKYVPTGVYLYKFLRNVYVTSRERIKQKQMELEDIQLQIQIVGNKLCLREAEFTDQEEQLRQETECLRQVRTRVHDIIAADEALRRVLSAPSAPLDTDLGLNSQSEHDRELIVDLLKSLKHENMAILEGGPTENMECGEHAPTPPHSAEGSVYSSISDVDPKQDCRVKIIKVTNVYKVAYLKHFVKQTRLRRAHKSAMLKKRMESIKKQLDDWQKSLNTVINDKLSILNMETHLDSARDSRDYSKPTIYSSDSDCDMRNSNTDIICDEYYNHNNCGQAQYINYIYENASQPTVVRELRNTEEDTDSYPIEVVHPCEGRDRTLAILTEETSSQMAIET